ncbi:hypothetical protein EDB80DRAFT_874484 [Ilyonectria destructans]|nr:hypothetical protein EDB80DRAFT_874484 [Ilyonectria destructans]
MATRRIIATEKTILDRDDTVEEKSNISPAVPNDVIFKLIAFTLAMIVVPIGSYFVTVHTIFKGTPVHFLVSLPRCLTVILGNSSYAGGLAALMANVVLVSYIIVAMKEDQSEQLENSKPEGKKDQ